VLRDCLDEQIGSVADIGERAETGGAQGNCDEVMIGRPLDALSRLGIIPFGRSFTANYAGSIAAFFLDFAPKILAKMVRNKLDSGSERTSIYQCPFKNILKKMKKRLVRPLYAGKSHRQT
jgi:hypothetical protein